ncbi:FAD-dependent oxidoreductase [Kitasatospora sp. NPDC002227]|uniref:FAD-dependent oxidoreductase n=1 Tax=Kitasatospora sp. NPDC002227 TaxID=3154773 RepID=UPI00332367BF
MPAYDITRRTRRHADPDVVVVGAGLAGLAAARALTGRGLTVQVLEATELLGGRMAARELDGFRLDTGSHLLATHPEPGRELGLQRLELRPLAPGVLVHTGGRRHRLAGPLDRARLGAALGRLASTPVERLLSRPETTTARALAERGLAPRTVDGLLRPLLTALLSDPALGTSSRVADLVLHGYAQGRLALPGTAGLPEQLAEGLPPGTVRLGVRVSAVSADGVDTESHGRTAARAVVVATDAQTAAALLPGLRLPDFHPVTTYYHVADRSPLAEPVLLLDADRPGGRSGVSHSLVLSEVDAGYAPPGQALIATTVLGRRTFDSGGPAGHEPEVRRRLAELYGQPTGAWEFLSVRHVPDAVPTMPPPHNLRRPVRVLAGLYVCGDHRDTSTVRGALTSGHRAAEAVCKDLGVAREPLVAEAAA